MREKYYNLSESVYEEARRARLNQKLFSKPFWPFSQGKLSF
jgi:hypothetical protein